MSHSKSFLIYTVDAFTREKFSGNAAAICLVHDNQVSSDVMQKIASEMNLSETAFVSPVGESQSFSKGCKFTLRWFTPTCEIPLCGHATLATAAVLIRKCGNKSKILEFDTQSGKLEAIGDLNGKISINLPCYEPQKVERSEYKDILKAAVGDLPVHEILVSPSHKILIRLKDDVTREELEALNPNDQELLEASSGMTVMGVIVTLSCSGKNNCVSDLGEKYDFISRYFAPWLGISEDPVTGSAHSVLGPYWSSVLNKKNLFARQCSRRGGELYIDLTHGKTNLQGDAVIVLEGTLYL